jgi:hypothetical protein
MRAGRVRVERIVFALDCAPAPISCALRSNARCCRERRAFPRPRLTSTSLAGRVVLVRCAWLRKLHVLRASSVDRGTLIFHLGFKEPQHKCVRGTLKRPHAFRGQWFPNDQWSPNSACA